MSDVATTDDLFFRRTGMDPKAVERTVDDALDGTDDGELFLEYVQSEMISFDEARRTVDRGDHYVIRPEIDWGGQSVFWGDPVPDGFRYASDTNDEWLTTDRLLEMLDD